MTPKNSIFIATSIDGYIADKNGGIEWLHSIENPDNDDLGYVEFTGRIDALVMGRVTFESVMGFDIPWPYDKPVYVLSRTMSAIPSTHQDHATLVNGSLSKVLSQIHANGHHRLYIDGGATIRSFLKEDLIDEMIVSTIPILLGGGAPLFSELPRALQFDLVSTKTYVNQLPQNHYERRR